MSSKPPRPTHRPTQRFGTVLVVDDEQMVRRVTARIVNSLGFDAIEAGDGEQALEFLRHRAPDLCAVLLDIAMPKLSGVEVLHLLRGTLPDIPVVLMSGYDESRLASGLDDSRLTFLHKPFRREELGRALDLVLARAVPA